MKLINSRMPRTLRTRLTISLSTVLGIVLIGFVLAVYLLLARDLRSEIDHTLLDRAEQLNTGDRPIKGEADGEDSTGVSILPSRSISSANSYVQVLSLEGEIVTTSANLVDGSLPFDLQSLAQLPIGDGEFSTLMLNEERIRLYEVPRTEDDQVVGYLQISRSLQQVDDTLSQLRLFAGVGVIVAIVLSAGVVWLTTLRSIRPLERVIKTAEGIGSSGDLGQRVEISTSQDEVGALATTFNSMLLRLQDSTTELRNAYDHVEETLAAQRRFVADASHELRTPLTTIRSNATLLSDYPNVTEVDRKAAMAQIDQEAARMSRLVHELLTLARADSGAPLEKESVSIGSLVEDVVDQVRSMSSADRQINLETKFTGELIGNQDLLRQLLLILLDNATKYSADKDPINMKISLKGKYVQVEISDSGIGISEDDLPKIFDRFYRADASRKTGGSGLGLSIAKWIVEQHEGSITATSVVGGGTTFKVLLPSIDG